MRIKLAEPITLSEVAMVTGATLNIPDALITHITTDSRIACPHDLFFAIAGEKYNGSDYIKDVMELGGYTLANTKDASLFCSDSVSALLALASHCKSKLKHLRYTVAITGSVGKTTTKELLSKVLGKKYKVHKTQNNFNNAIGVSYTLLTAPYDCEVLVAELGMNHRGEISNLSRAIKPNVAVITNVGSAHIGNLGSRENIALAKLEILDGLDGKLILPYNEPLLNIDGAITFSSKHPSAKVFLSEISSEQALSYRLYIDKKAQNFIFSTDAPHLADCMSAVIAATISCDMDINAVGRFSAKSVDNARQSVIKLGNFTLIDDSYNASLESIEAGIKYSKGLKDYPIHSVLIGDILELGEYSSGIHYKVGELCAKYGIDKIYAYGKYCTAIRAGALDNGFNEDNIYINENTELPDISAQQIICNVNSGELIYAKASHATMLSRVIEALKERDKGG